MLLKEYWIKDQNYINSLIQEIKDNIDESYSYKSNVRGEKTYWKHFVKKSKNFKPVLDLLNQYVLYEAWGNILNKNDYVEEHNHFDPILTNRFVDTSGILYLTNHGPGTFFKDFNKTIKPQVGKIVVFDSKYLHSVKKCDTDEPRITLAFNGRKKESYEF